MVSTLLLLLFGFVSTRDAGHGCLAERVDLIELNHFYDPQGRHVYDQVIFYNRHPGTGKFQVRAWCLVEDRESLSRRPVYQVATGIYRVDWLDSDQQVLRCIESRLHRESWSHVDPERIDKKKYDERLRLSLAQPPKRRKPMEEKLTKELAEGTDATNSEGTSETASLGKNWSNAIAQQPK
ncbi:MAG: hypothetical protein MUD03_07095 [Pirellula sp.]|jgi:hypothetical protein|nr:hypothetical protein [Pirellula sp.]